jgi:hypothetical protein
LLRLGQILFAQADPAATGPARFANNIRQYESRLPTVGNEQ